jgi:hypothetical protein
MLYGLRILPDPELFKFRKFSGERPNSAFLQQDTLTLGGSIYENYFTQSRSGGIHVAIGVSRRLGTGLPG